MSKHTPRPWEVVTHPDIQNGYLVRPVLFGGCVSVLPEYEGGHVVIKNSHDAHLIAAAPDMLNALERVLADYEEYTDKGIPALDRMISRYEEYMTTGAPADAKELQSVQEQVASAIAKAKGEHNG